MKKLYSFAAAILMASAITAQVNVTFKVDVTDYLAGGATLNSAGLRIGGNFATQGATVGANAMEDWSPDSEFSAMTQEGSSNIWAITVTYPSSSIGVTQLYKFINGTWAPTGDNEGRDSTSFIASDGCGADDGGGNINRTLVVPSTDQTFIFCWNKCTQCDGSPASFELVDVVTNFGVYPNPSTDVTNVAFNVTSPSTAVIEVYNALGQRVMFNDMGSILPGAYNQTLDMSGLNSGMYFVKLNVDGRSRTTRVNVVK